MERKQFQGVLNILSFNRHFYGYGILVLCAITALWLTTNFSEIIYWILFSAFIYGLSMPLIISAYVYDFSGYYDFNWLSNFELENSKSTQIININAGFDETSYIVKKNFPKSELKVFDFYNSAKHTEPAIIRARKVSLVYPHTKRISTSTIPLNTNSVDIIFLLSAAHEIRSFNEKVTFLTECRRVCKPKGKVIMVEHLRDMPNFFAFSIGFTHFFSKRVWQKAYDKAGFFLSKEEKFTPFMSVFQFQSKK